MQKEKTVSGKTMQSKCGWSAFDGTMIKGWPIKTIVHGNIVYQNEMIDTKICGQKVMFDE